MAEGDVGGAGGDALVRDDDLRKGSGSGGQKVQQQWVGGRGEQMVTFSAATLRVRANRAATSGRARDFVFVMAFCMVSSSSLLFLLCSMDAVSYFVCCSV